MPAAPAGAADVDDLMQEFQARLSDVGDEVAQLTASNDGKGVSDATAAALRDLQGESGVSGVCVCAYGWGGHRSARLLVGVHLPWSAALQLYLARHVSDIQCH
jgi:hypothetical protein